jgi:asparagine synthetase B (glutamine-hydrolysing)
MTISDPSPALFDAIRTGVAARPADALLLSGGVDSSLLAAVAAEERGDTPLAITVTLESDSADACPVHGDELAAPCNSDHDAARQVASWLGLRWQPIRLPARDALDALIELCLALRSFDLGNLNNIPLHAGALRASRVGAERVWTGDDADSLFGGYAFLRRHADWPAYLRERIPTIRPPFLDIAPAAGTQPIFPYLHPAVLGAASALSRDEVLVKIPAAERPAPPSFVDQLDDAVMAAEWRVWGKAPLRRIAERILPEEIAWRPKTDLEFGSGMCALEPLLAEAVTADDRERLDRTGIRFFNDAHRGLYLRWVAAGGSIPAPEAGKYACRSCGGGVANGRSHCPTCGAWPAR